MIKLFNDLPKFMKEKTKLKMFKLDAKNISIPRIIFKNSRFSR